MTTPTLTRTQTSLLPSTCAATAGGHVPPAPYTHTDASPRTSVAPEREASSSRFGPAPVRRYGAGSMPSWREYADIQYEDQREGLAALRKAVSRQNPVSFALNMIGLFCLLISISVIVVGLATVFGG